MKHPRKIRLFKKVRVWWVDSIFLSGWKNFNEIQPRDLRCQSCGFLVGKTKKDILVASSIDEEKTQAGGIIVIPRVAITKIRVIKA